jgi:hypothetical protein
VFPYRSPKDTGYASEVALVMDEARARVIEQFRAEIHNPALTHAEVIKLFDRQIELGIEDSEVERERENAQSANWLREANGW